MKQTNILLLTIFLALNVQTQAQRVIQDFNSGWKFKLGDNNSHKNIVFNDAGWRTLDLPHDWSIEGKFDSTHRAGNAGGALPGDIGWYRKTFQCKPAVDKKTFIEFDGVYQNSEVWINEKYLGKWPYGYTSFQYDLTPHLKNGKNVIAVKVDNAQQPNSRWYSGSGIYRDVRLITTGATHIKQWGIFVTTPKVNVEMALVNVDVNFENVKLPLKVHTKILDQKGQLISQATAMQTTMANKSIQQFEITKPLLWSIDQPNLYRLQTTVYQDDKVVDSYNSTFGIRYFNLDAKEGFSLNGKPLKIFGVCLHHDLGALGAAFNKSAAKRQLQIMKDMGCNAIRTAHNPPDPKFLDLCDEMGFLVMDESFDMWAKKKNKFDYFQYFPEWHKKDLEAMVLRDRNHPSVFMWSIGNEIREQFDSTGITLGKELVEIVKNIDPTRPVTCALSENDPKKNFIYQSKALDVIGLNYHIEAYEDFPKNYPGEKFIATENVSGLASRGHYDMPADSVRYWPPSSKFKYVPDGNADYSVSAYDNVAAYWGSTHEQTWRIIKKHNYLSGLFVWSGFDFLGEPVPYPFPARSSYYGIVDLAGFPKDVYYMYQSEWTDKPVLHIAPHWNWKPEQNVDVKIYYNNADEVELFLNNRSLGSKQKPDSAFHVLWRVPFEAGELKAVSRKNDKTVLEKVVRTAGPAAKIELITDRNSINLKNNELAFVTIRVLDKDGNLVPNADHLVTVTTATNAKVVGMDNGYPADLNSLKDKKHNVYKGLAVVIVNGLKAGTGFVEASSPGLKPSKIQINIQ